MHRARIPADVATVLAQFHDLGDAARRALWLSEIRASREIAVAARNAAALLRRVQP